MRNLVRLCLAVACVAAVGPAIAASDTARSPAKLQFKSATALAGISYGIVAVDARQRLLGERLQTDVMAGLRTIWYSCPNERAPAEGSRMSFEFEAGASYTLTCRLGGEAEIRRTDNC